MRNFTDESSFERKEKMASGKLDNAGYYTIPFSKNLPVKEGERFAIVVYLKTPDAVHPMAIEYKADATTSKVDLSDGEGYISTNGSVWENVEETQKCNLCIKAYAGK